MARYIVPSLRNKTKQKNFYGVDEIILLCQKCHAMYVSDIEYGKFPEAMYCESCPECGYKYNTTDQRIPLWMYNLIKYFRQKMVKWILRNE